MGNFLQSPVSLFFRFLFVCYDPKKGREDFCFLCGYFLLLRSRAAATATMTTIASPMVMYVAEVAPLVGGIRTGLGVGAIVMDGVLVGAIVCVLVGAGVGAEGVEIGTAAGALETSIEVSATEL